MSFRPPEKEQPVQRSLTVLLPVYNAQSTLTATVADVLEVVSELSGQLELVIVDDGSSDATGEIAHDLARRYPQVRAIHHGSHEGREAAVQTGLGHSTGEIVFLHDENSGMTLDGIPSLWHAAHEHPAAAGPPKTTSWSKANRSDSRSGTRQSGYRMIDRRTIDAARAPSRPVRPNFLSGVKDFAMGE